MPPKKKAAAEVKYNTGYSMFASGGYLLIVRGPGEGAVDQRLDWPRYDRLVSLDLLGRGRPRQEGSLRPRAEQPEDGNGGATQRREEVNSGDHGIARCTARQGA